MTITERIRELEIQAEVYGNVESEARDRAIEYLDNGDYAMAKVYADIAEEDEELAREAREELEGLRAIHGAGLTVDASAFFIEGSR